MSKAKVNGTDTSAAVISSCSVGATTSKSSDHKRRICLNRLCCRCLKQHKIRTTQERSSHTKASTSSEKKNVYFIQRLFSPEYSSFRKVSWWLILLTLTTVCLWQVGDRIMHYLDAPIMHQVTVDRQHKVQFPAVTLCPAREPFNSSWWDQKHLMFSSNFSLNDAWEEYELKINVSMHIFSACNDDQSRCDFDRGIRTNPNISVIYTIWGKCLTVFPGLPTEYRGASSFMEVDLKSGPYNKHIFGREVAAMEAGSGHRHEAYYLVEWLGLSRETTIHLSLKEFYYLNSSKNPCDHQDAVTECKNKCVDELLDKSVNCSLPFMMSKLPACETPDEARHAREQCRQFYQTFSYAQCPCKRPCIQKVYSYSLNSAERLNTDWTNLLLVFTDNLVENVKESYAYSFSALISDVGGGLGFFLGVSILSLLKIFKIVPSLI